MNGAQGTPEPTRAIGVDIGGTAIKAGRLAGGKVEAEIERPTPAREGVESVVRTLAAMVEELAAGWVSGQAAWSLGIGCAGLIDPERGVVVTSPNLPGWKDAPLADLAEQATGRRPIVQNDANAFTLAEARHGAGAGARNVVGITLGTGVGGGLILGGRLWTGTHGYAGEIGHVPLVAGGPLCSCGSRGCVEAMIGTPAIIRDYCGRSGKRDSASLSPGEISARARAGDSAALETWREIGRYLGLALGGLANLLDPDLFVIGGGVSGSADLMFPSARTALEDQMLAPGAHAPGLVAAALGPAAGWIGAALAALEPMP